MGAKLGFDPLLAAADRDNRYPQDYSGIEAIRPVGWHACRKARHRRASQQFPAIGPSFFISVMFRAGRQSPARFPALARAAMPSNTIAKRNKAKAMWNGCNLAPLFVSA